MAAVLPTDLFSGYTSDGTNITIPIASLPALNATEANATTGNGMEVLRALIDAAHGSISGLATEAKPVRATLTKNNPTMASGAGVTPGTQRQTYTASFDLAPIGYEMADEPA